MNALRVSFRTGANTGRDGGQRRAIATDVWDRVTIAEIARSVKNERSDCEDTGTGRRELYRTRAYSLRKVFGLGKVESVLQETRYILREGRLLFVREREEKEMRDNKRFEMIVVSVSMLICLALAVICSALAG